MKSPSTVWVSEVRRLWNDGAHNAFTDMIRFGGRLYLAFRSHPVSHDVLTGSSIVILASEDGFEWRPHSILTENPGNETAFLFEDNGDLLAIGRGRPTTRICRAQPPYTEMCRVDVDRFIGGPLVVKWGTDTLVGGRKVTDDGPRTVLSWLVGDTFVDCAELPSGGDNSYPGFVAIDRHRALVSYYSSHEGSGDKTAPCAIYLARLELKS